jgi:isoleucyl-tRNA synthetase
MAQRDYKSTLHLPQTSFPMYGKPSIEDGEIMQCWEKEGVYNAAMTHNDGAKKFILHVGPPYANGNIHLGHAYNGILKDIITKAYRMAGYHVPVIPGWDCHGLPIELKVLKEQPQVSSLDLKKACRATAQHWIDIQRAEFKRLGIIMDWEHPYITMSASYESSTMRACADLAEQGFIERKHKTVAWCYSCQTTLATAEIEYQERKDPSLYVLFPVAQMPQKLREHIPGDEEMSLLVWTTTPWTLPLNRAVAVCPGEEYSLVRINERRVIVGAACCAQLQDTLGTALHEEARFRAEDMQGVRVQHPFAEGVTVPVLLDTMVSTDDGTACVHIAPGCGPEDYELGIKQGLEIYAPITPDGRYDGGIVPEELQGMPVYEAHGWVIKKLVERGRLVHKASIRHSYPHCWRCHTGLIYRATKQWFFDLHHAEVQKRALAAIDEIRCNPTRGANFLRATVEHRWEWCLSRQRMWGVPIPALICMHCDHAVLNTEVMKKAVEGVACEGIEFWDRVSVNDLVHNMPCEQCGTISWRKETDILDVWFDSGVSHYAVLQQREDAAFPADLYLEGIDQYRGWYQSSLLTSIALSGKPPMRMIMTHGFTVDEHGEKMSKSKGNVVAPQTMIDRLGTDGVRLWVASIDHEHDIVVSEVLLKNVEQVYRKVRNTVRFLLQNCFDIHSDKDLISYDQLRMLDRLALLDFVVFHERMRTYYLAGDMTAIFHGLADYCTVNLSAIYCDITKDRLYVAGKESHERRSAQTVLYHMLDALTKLIAPIFSCTAEQIAQHYAHAWQGSVHLQNMVSWEAIIGPVSYEERDRLKFVAQEQWFVRDRSWLLVLLEVRASILKAIEPQREQGIIKHSLQAAVNLYIAPQYHGYQVWQEICQEAERRQSSPEELLEELCIVSKISLVHDKPSDNAAHALVITVEQAAGAKCPRCWRWQMSKHEDGLCDRCDTVINNIS